MDDITAAFGEARHADRAQISDFVNALFRYADPGTFVSLRAFDQHDGTQPPFLIAPIEINGDLGHLVDEATNAAERCLQASQAVVFAPPVCTFSNPQRARTQDLANGLTLSIELDEGNTLAALEYLTQLIGQPTDVVASGSDWPDPKTGELFPKLHIHWRLSEPTRTEADHLTLARVRDLAARLVRADPTGKPVVHPLRWPGSWNRKPEAIGQEPRLARILSGLGSPDAEIHLAEVAEIVAEAVEAAGGKDPGGKELPESSTPEANEALLTSAFATIPNPGREVHYDEWMRFGYAAYRAFGGSEAGKAAWNAWSQKSEKYDVREQEAAWGRIGRAIRGGTGTRTVGAGTIFFHAGAVGWQRPPLRLFETKNTDYLHQNPDNERPHRSLRILTLDELDDLADPEWLLHRLIPRQSLSVIFGPPKSYKSFLIFSAGLHIASGSPWFGRPTSYGAVIYIAGEGVGGLKARSKAMREAYGIGSLIPFWIIPRSVNFRVEGEVEALIVLIRDTIGRSPFGPVPPIAWVIIDTLSRAMPGADENSAQDVGLVIASCDHVRETLACAVSLVHHEGKDGERGARGTSALRGAWDAALRAKARGKTVTLEVFDQRDAEAGEILNFEMQEVPVGIGRTSLVPMLMAGGSEEAQEAPQEPRRRRPSGIASIALSVLESLVAGPQGAILPPSTSRPPGLRGASIGQFRQAFYAKLGDRDQEARKKAWQRSFQILQTESVIGTDDPWVWLASRVSDQNN